MPLVDTAQVAPDLLAPLGSVALPEPQKAGPSAGSWYQQFSDENLEATFRQSNVIGSAIARVENMWGTSNTSEPGYNPWDDIKGTKYEEHWNSFVDSGNAKYTSRLKAQIDQEEADRQTIAAQGGLASQLMVGAADPTLLIPVGGEIALAGKGVWNLGRGAVAGARAAGIGVTAQEAGLQTTQETRTAKESVENIGGAVVLGSLLGGATAKLLSRPEQLAGEDALERIHNDAIAAQQAGPQSAGAASVTPITTADLTVAGRVAEKVAGISRFLSPGLRANFRAAPSARRFSQELAENTLYQGMHDEGRSLGAAVETEARSTLLARMFDAVKAHNDIYSEMKKSGVNMSRNDFEEAIGQAMRRGDVGENDFVSRAAKAWRERVTDPFTNEAINEGLLPADVNVTTAPSYFSRVYNKERMNAQEPDFKARVSGFYEQQIASDYAQSVESFQSLMKRFDQHEADVKLTPGKRTKALADLEKEGEALDTANAFHVDRLAEVNDLRQKARKASDEGNFTEADVLKLEARQHYTEGGEPLKTYVAERRKLRQRQNRLKEPASKASRDLRLSKIAKKRAAAERLFYDRWEIKKLGEGVNPHAPDVRPNFKAHADDIANDVFDKITGRAQTSSSSVDPEYMTALTRGPLKDRTFNVPDELIEPFLEDNVRSVMERFGRTMSADISLTRRFGRADMRDQITTIHDEYRKLREDPGLSEKDRAALTDDEKGAVHDLEAMRDLLRGTYKAQENSSNYGRVVRALMAFNYLRSMGGVTISNIGEVFRPGMVHGMGRYMNEGIGSLITNMKAIKLAVGEAQLAGQVTEKVLQHRMMSLGEIGDPYRSGTAVERWLTNSTRAASKWNGLVYWTDGMKSISSVLSQNRIIQGALSGKDARTLAYLGIDEDMAGRIAKQFTEHGETMDKVHVANTQRWTDADAVRAYRSAVSKDVDSIIVTKSVGDVPLFANTATGRLILQFRNYNFAAHQRLLLRGLQEGQTQFISGLIGMTSLGMLGAVLRSWRGGEQRFERFSEAASNPGYLVGEGLDTAGVFTLPMDASNTFEKLTQAGFGKGFNPIKTPLMAAGTAIAPNASMQGSSARFANVGPAGAVLGPSFGLAFDQAPKALGASTGVFGNNVSQSQQNAAQGMIPFNSYVGVREALQYLNGDSPYASSGH